MIPLSFREIADITGGILSIPDVLRAEGNSEDTCVAGVVTTDSREIGVDGIFVAKPGEFDDGHRFVGAALQAGAKLAIVERNVDVAIAQLRVKDSVESLGALAREVVARVRARGNLRVVAVTGSNGKTTTKNLIRDILSRVGVTVAADKSYNNEVGGPTTMLKVTKETEFLVLEYGASDVGEIARLIGLVSPDIGVVLKVGLAHAGVFGGIDKTVEAKSEMVRDLSDQQIAVLNIDDPRVAAMAGRTRAQVRTFGLDERADVYASDISVHAAGTDFTMHIRNNEITQSHSVGFHVLGEHHVMNALAAASVALEFGVPLSAIVEALETVELAERWRMQVMGGRDGITVINDAYNASPDSTAAALKTLAEIKSAGTRTFAVLGEMSELGEFSGEEHDRIGLLAVRLGISQLVVVGSSARRLHISAISEGSWDGESHFVENSDDAFEYVVAQAKPGDTILVKSSNSAGLRFLGDRLGKEFSC